MSFYPQGYCILSILLQVIYNIVLNIFALFQENGILASLFQGLLDTPPHGSLLGTLGISTSASATFPGHDSFFTFTLQL